MNKDDVIYVAGHRGLVGSAIVRALKAAGYNRIVTRTHAECDLTDAGAVVALFEKERPAHVFLAAARVGGIHANNAYPAEFIRDNLAIQTNVIHQSWKSGVKRLLFLGSSCIYPKDAPQPLKEEYLLTGPLEPTNRPYALAKIAGVEMCWSYNRQYGTKFLAAMPTNLFGPGDNYHPENSHVIPALIRKFHEAKVAGAPQVMLWGTGAPRREFLYSDDMAEACLFLMNLPDERYALLLDVEKDGTSRPPLINIGVGDDITIRALAGLIGEVVEFEGDVEFDVSRPDGTMRKLMDVSRLTALGWRPTRKFRPAIEGAYRAFLESEHSSRPT
jgi:GDP-L-fucose synthase